jgi:hypothetical protein
MDTDQHPEYHFTLSDGTNTLGFLCCDPSGKERSLRHWARQAMQRTSMKTGTGRTAYSDLEPPFYAMAQDDWAGGRAGMAVLDDPTKYNDATGIMSWIPGKLTLGPLATDDTTLRVLELGWVTTDDETTVGSQYPEANGYKRAQVFTPASTITVQGLLFIYDAALEAGYDMLMVELCSTTGADPYPNTVLVTGYAYLEDGTEKRGEAMFNAAVSLTAGTSYAVVFSGIYWGTGSVQIRGHSTSKYTGKAWKYSYEGSSWSEDTTIADYKLAFVDGSPGPFFAYKGLLHVVSNAGSNGAKLYARGKRAAATAATRQTITTATDFSAWTGATVKVIEGKGAGQWAKLQSTQSSGTVLYLDRPMDIVPDTTSIIAVTGTWQLVLTLSYGVSSVAVTGEIVYLAHRTLAAMTRYRWTNASGHQSATDASQGDELLLFRDADNDPALWRGLANQISNAPLQAWGTNLTFGTAMDVGTADSRITALTVYDDMLYVGKEDGLWAVQEDVPRRIPLDFGSMAGPENCRGMVSWNLHLAFPLRQSLERMYSNQVDDFGPNLGEGLPEGRQGNIACILPLPGLLIVAVDAGAAGTSCVLAYNSLGWHEMARAEIEGARITALGYDTLADGLGRLYWGEGATLRWLMMSGANFDRTRDATATYAATGEIITGWLGTEMMDIEKCWHELAVFIELNGATLAASYQLDDEDATWVSVSPDAGDPVRRFDLGDVVGTKLRLKLTLTRATADTTTPVVEAFSVEAVGRVTPRFAYSTHVLLENQVVTLNGKPVARGVESVIGILDGWASSPQPLTMRHVLAEYDNRSVFVEPVDVRVLEWQHGAGVAERRVARLGIVEIGAP